MGILRGALAAAIALLTGMACSTETELTIRAVGESAEDEPVPLPGVRLDILPYDIDSLYATLEARSSPGPPPSADSIRGLARVYQDACASYRVTGDSIEAAGLETVFMVNEVRLKRLLQRLGIRLQPISDEFEHYGRRAIFTTNREQLLTEIEEWRSDWRALYDEVELQLLGKRRATTAAPRLAVV